MSKKTSVDCAQNIIPYERIIGHGIYFAYTTKPSFLHKNGRNLTASKLRKLSKTSRRKR